MREGSRKENLMKSSIPVPPGKEEDRISDQAEICVGRKRKNVREV